MNPFVQVPRYRRTPLLKIRQVIIRTRFRPVSPDRKDSGWSDHSSKAFLAVLKPPERMAQLRSKAEILGPDAWAFCPADQRDDQPSTDPAELPRGHTPILDEMEQVDCGRGIERRVPDRKELGVP